MKNRLGAIHSRLLMVVLSALLVILAPVQAMAAELDEEKFKQTATWIMGQCIATDDATYESLQESRIADLDFALLSYGVPCGGKDYLAILASWRGALEECGTYQGTEDIEQLISSFEISERNGEVELSGEMSFAGRDADVTFTFEEDGTVTALTIGGHYTASEIMKKAGSNTIIGMGVVFAVLIFMAWIISCMKYIGVIQEKLSKKNAQPESAPAQAAAAPAVVPEVTADDDIDEETLFVISAVIAEELARNPLRADE